jgi:hypothetical protein
MLGSKVERRGQCFVVAERPGDWNDGVARLVALLLKEAAPADLHADPRFVRYRGELEMAIARGLRPRRHRPRDPKQTAHDLMIIADAETVPQAAQALSDWYRISMHAARKRVARLRGVADLQLKPGRPFGHKSPTSFK